MMTLSLLRLCRLILLAGLGLIWGGYSVLAQEPDREIENNLSATRLPPPTIELAGQIGGTVHNSWGVSDVTVAGNIAYVGAYDGLRLIDIANPAFPQEVGFANLGGIGKVAVVEDIAYAAGGNWLYFVDISNQTAPTELGSYHDSYLDGITDVAVVGNIAYLTDFFKGLRLVDLSNFAAPREVGWYYPEERTFGVAVAGNMTYIAGASGLRLLDTSNPSNPFEVGSHPGLAGWSNDVALKGQTVYLADDGLVENGLSIIDVSKPTHPKLLGYLNLSGAQHVTVQGNYAYILTGGDLYIVDVSRSNQPVEVGLYNNNLHPWADELAVQNNYVYVAGREDGLLILRLIRHKISGTIRPRGGVLLSAGEDTHLIFPNGAFTETVTLTYRHLWQDQAVGERVGLGHTFEVSAVSAATGQPAQLAPGQTFAFLIRYTDAEKGPAIEDTIALYYWNGQQWLKEPSSVVDPLSNTIAANPDHWPTLWTVLGETRRMVLPLILKK
ncbi:MAG: hypothetical protein HS114_18865 [Anaerolineales bacterium]|nr:hypothetical protein [Anaerolineales bacterium]